MHRRDRRRVAERPSAVPPPDEERRAQLREFADAADVVGETDLADQARRLDRLPLDRAAIRRLALAVGPLQLPGGLNPKALDAGAAPASEQERQAFRRLERLHHAAEALRELRAPSAAPSWRWWSRT